MQGSPASDPPGWSATASGRRRGGCPPCRRGSTLACSARSISSNSWGLDPRRTSRGASATAAVTSLRAGSAAAASTPCPFNRTPARQLGSALAVLRVELLRRRLECGDALERLRRRDRGVLRGIRGQFCGVRPRPRMQRPLAPEHGLHVHRPEPCAARATRARDEGGAPRQGDGVHCVFGQRARRWRGHKFRGLPLHTLHDRRRRRRQAGQPPQLLDCWRVACGRARRRQRVQLKPRRRTAGRHMRADRAGTSFSAPSSPGSLRSCSGQRQRRGGRAGGARDDLQQDRRARRVLDNNAAGPSHSSKYGFGLVNAHRAVAAARAGRATDPSASSSSARPPFSASRCPTGEPRCRAA